MVNPYFPEEAREELRKAANLARVDRQLGADDAECTEWVDLAIKSVKERYPEAFHTDATVWGRVFVHQPMGGGEIVPNVVPMRAFRRAAGRR